MEQVYSKNPLFNKNYISETENIPKISNDISPIVVDDDVYPKYKNEQPPTDTSVDSSSQWESLHELMMNDLGTAFDNSDAFSEGFHKSFFGKSTHPTYDDAALKKAFGVSGEGAGNTPYLILGYLLSSKIPGIKALPAMATGAALGASMSAVANTTQKAVVDPLFNKEGVKAFINRMFKDALISSLGGGVGRKLVSMSPLGGSQRALAASQFFDEGALLLKKVLEPESKGSGGRAW
ncbi:MAG: hypothetical protein EOM67_14350 [Spirochaetia bacterium]|nr:hypothetical protein [Spirochaetia bacterium]